MAGIGFELKRLTNQDNLIGIFRAYTHATVVSAGPWLCTVLALAFMYPLGAGEAALEQMNNFQIIVVYNFVASLIISAPVFMVVTRYLADCIHRKDLTSTPTLVIISIALVYLLLLPFAVYYYFYYVEMDIVLRLNAVANLYLVSLIWILGVYVTALKDYKSVTLAFVVGMTIAVVISQFSPLSWGSNGTMTGFNIGLAWIGFSLLGRIFVEYPYKMVGKVNLAPYFSKYWDLAVGGILYNISIWIDKCVMWIFAPEAVTLPNKMTYYPHYDSAMFLAYLTVIPTMAIFIFSIETSFFLKYQKFYHDILTHKNLAKIIENQKKIVDVLIRSARNFFIVQGVCTVAVILAASRIFSWFEIPFLEIGMFRIGVLASFFHIFALFEMVILAYFDCRKKMLAIQAIFLLSNGIFTYITIESGFSYYGFGYFFASLLTAAISSIVLYNHLRQLPYHAFITSNSSV